MKPSILDQSHLPSYENRLASESRIAKINEIYNRNHKRDTQRHRDSIISDNSTSVVSDIHDGPYLQESQPVVDLNYKQQESFEKRPPINIAQPDFSTIKPEDGFNPFRPKFTEARPRSRDEMEQELHFTPKLRSRRSIIYSRTPSHEDPAKEEALQFFKTKNRGFSGVGKNESTSTRSRERFKELKARLGKPLPLGYLSSASESKEEDPQSHRKPVESRWKRILSSADKKTDWSILQDRIRSPSDQGSVRMHVSDSQASLAGLLNDDEDKADEESKASSFVGEGGQLDSINENLRTNTEKLDQIMTILNDKRQHNGKIEVIAWVACIIVLVLLNVFLSSV
ncbi:LAFA_0F14840g1_1 [Lachancea sp. 'fantastica']|nr:LAFA_0F14840g1_1 [Lachancea sp. 'fantastica']